MKELLKLSIEIAEAVVKATEDSVKELKELGKEIIVKRTKSGKGVQGTSEVPLKKLSSTTVERRRRANLASDTSPATSNLTESGQLLDSLESKTKQTKDGPRVVIQAGTVKDRKKSRYHKNTGRNFLDFTEKDDNRLTDLVAKNIVKAINKIKIG